MKLKERIKEAKGVEVETIKLVHKGKNPADTSTIEEAGIKENDIVLMTKVVVNKIKNIFYY